LNRGITLLSHAKFDSTLFFSFYLIASINGTYSSLFMNLMSNGIDGGLNTQQYCNATILQKMQ